MLESPGYSHEITYIPDLWAPSNTALDLGWLGPRPLDEDGLAAVETAVVWDIIPKIILCRILTPLEQDSIQDSIGVFPALGLHHACGLGSPPDTGDGVPLIAAYLRTLAGDLVVIPWKPGARVVLVCREGVIVLVGDKSCQFNKALFCRYILALIRRKLTIDTSSRYTAKDKRLLIDARP